MSGGNTADTGQPAKNRGRRKDNNIYSAGPEQTEILDAEYHDREDQRAEASSVDEDIDGIRLEWKVSLLSTVSIPIVSRARCEFYHHV